MIGSASCLIGFDNSRSPAEAAGPSERGAQWSGLIVPKPLGLLWRARHSGRHRESCTLATPFRPCHLIAWAKSRKARVRCHRLRQATFCPSHMMGARFSNNFPPFAPHRTEWGVQGRLQASRRAMKDSMRTTVAATTRTAPAMAITLIAVVPGAPNMTMDQNTITATTAMTPSRP